MSARACAPRRNAAGDSPPAAAGSSTSTGSREAHRPSKFVVRHRQGGQFHFVIVAENGQVVATSETYMTKRRCLEGIDAVKRLAADAPVENEAPDG
jgi:uncharacterized protein